MEQIIKLINEYQRIIIHGHTRPDGHCIGSQIGLRDILKETYPNKEIYAVGPMSEFVSFLGELDIITDDLYNGALAIVVDCGNSERISDQRFKLADKVIKIDHHVPVEDYGDVNYVLEDEPACAAIITEIMDTYKMKINKQGAMALYTGILTDTGRFRFDTVNGKTLRLAAILLENGVTLFNFPSALVSNKHKYFSSVDNCIIKVTLSFNCVVEKASQLSKQLNKHGSGILILKVNNSNLLLLLKLFSVISWTINPSFLVISLIFKNEW